MPIETILVTGAVGCLGSLVGDIASDPSFKSDSSPYHVQLAEALAKSNNKDEIQLILTDVSKPRQPSDVNSVALSIDMTESSQISQLFETEFGVPDVIYCMHGIMSRGSEDNFELGIKVNIDSVVSLLQATRQYGSQARKLIKLIYTSSIAVYGGPVPEIVTPSTIAVPQSAYGMEKLVCESFINEFTRRGFLDGRIYRLPTIVVRPGAPTGAASSFLSGIIREPLNDKQAICPIGNSIDAPELNLKVWLASPKTTVRNLVYGRTIPETNFLSHTRVVCLPGITVSIREMLQALEKVGGKKALDRVEFKDDETNRMMVSSWPPSLDCSYAIGVGFISDEGGIDGVVADFNLELKN